MEQKHPIAWHVPNLINICIDSVEDGEMTGKIYHCYSEEAIAFSNIIRMIETVEEFFDCLQFPQAATQTRSFHRKESVQGKKLEKKLEQEQKQIEQEIKLYMKDNESAFNERYRITWTNVDTARLDTKRVKEEKPEVHRQFMQTTSSRRFTVKAA